MREQEDHWSTAAVQQKVDIAVAITHLSAATKSLVVLLVENSSKCLLNGFKSVRGAQKNKWSALPHRKSEISCPTNNISMSGQDNNRRTSKSENQMAFRTSLSLDDFLLY